MLIHNVVLALEDPTFPRARALLLERIGNSALVELRKAARTSSVAAVRSRATDVAEALRKTPR